MRRLLPVLAAIAALGSIFADEATEKQAAAAAMEKWLALTDAGDYAASYKEAAASFQKAVTADAWASACKQARSPFGKTLSRKLVSSAFLANGMPGVAGPLVLNQYASSFANLAAATETVTFQREGDGQWRATGYYIKPGAP